MIDRAEEHLGPRAGPYLRKFYPWYLDRLDADKSTAAELQQLDELDQVRALLAGLADGDREREALAGAAGR